MLPQIDDAELLVVPGDYDATYTHVKDYARSGLDTGDSGSTIWFFGGSALFGIGQRDDHTIPSEIARLAEAAGTPVVAATFVPRGRRGRKLVSWRGSSRNGNHRT